MISNDTIWLVRALGIFLLISFVVFACIQWNKHRASVSQQLSEYLQVDLKDIPLHSEHENNGMITELSHLKQKQDEGISFEVNSWRRRLVLMALGVSSGLIRGLWGIAGVPIMFFALITNINFNEFRSSTATAIILSEIVSIIQLYVIEDRMDIDNKWMEYIAILSGGFMGLVAGNLWAKYYLSQFWFQWFIMYIILMGGIVLTLQEIWTPFQRIWRKEDDHPALSPIMLR